MLILTEDYQDIRVNIFWDSICCI